MKSQRSVITVVSLCMAVAIPNVAYTASINGQGTWETTLQGRDLDGDLTTAEAYFDTTLGITWLANASYAGNISMDWTSAIAWVAALNPYSSGITGWRLPDTDPVNGTDYSQDDYGWDVSAPGTLYAGSTASEMAYMYYNTLGNNRHDGLTNTGPFSNIHIFEQDIFWSASEPSGGGVWYFYFVNGYQSVTDKSDDAGDSYSWAVHDGDVGVDCSSFCGPVSIVSIDIRPGSKKNPVHPRSKGKLKVSILSSETFDASRVNVSTIQFGPGSAVPFWYRLDDVDNDGNWDLVLKFKTQKTGIACGDTEATLTGQMYNGLHISGTDTVKTVGCKRIKRVRLD